ncbi:hypothetical protein HK096_007276, partial [Nowakowskiella sp. JEL0078]
MKQYSLTTLKGIYLGAAVVFLNNAFKAYWKKRTMITLCNVVQILFFMGFDLSVMIFLAIPAEYLNCGMRMYGAVIIMDAQLVTVWVINWIKLSAIVSLYILSTKLRP